MLDPTPRQRVERVRLVQDELDGNVVGSDVGKHLADGADRLRETLLGKRCVRDVQDEVGDERLLERRRKAFDELRREAADETDGVRHEIALAVVLERARRRIERLEETIVDRSVGASQGVQERRLPDVRVAGQRDGRSGRPQRAPCAVSSAGSGGFAGGA